MKNSIAFILGLVLFTHCAKKQPTKTDYQSKLNPLAASVYKKLCIEQSQVLQNDWPISEIDGKAYIAGFVQLSKNDSTFIPSGINLVYNQQNNNPYPVRIEVNQFCKAIEHPNIKYIEIRQKAKINRK